MSDSFTQCVRFPYTGSRERFLKDVAEHEMTVVLDTEDGHRHLQFRRPGTGFFWFDLICWPGTLAIRSDMGDFMLARERDMFAWVEHCRGNINPGYWSEKVRAGKDLVREHTPGDDALRAYVGDVVEVLYDHIGDLLKDDPQKDDPLKVACEIVDLAFEAIDWGDALRDVEVKGIQPFSDFDPGDHLDYTWQWIWCCWAMAWGIAQYRAARP